MTQADRPQDSFPVPLSLKGRTVVITGGTRGIGRMMAEAIAAAGANVVIAGRDGAAVEATVAAVSGVAQGGVAQGRVWGMACDVQDLAQVEALAQGAIDRFGSLDVWFNNAAVTHPFGPVLEIPYDRWRQVIDTNLVGTYHGTIAALKQDRKSVV